MARGGIVADCVRVADGHRAGLLQFCQQLHVNTGKGHAAARMLDCTPHRLLLCSEALFVASPSLHSPFSDSSPPMRPRQSVRLPATALQGDHSCRACSDNSAVRRHSLQTSFRLSHSIIINSLPSLLRAWRIQQPAVPVAPTSAILSLVCLPPQSLSPPPTALLSLLRVRAEERATSKRQSRSKYATESEDPPWYSTAWWAGESLQLVLRKS